MPAAIPIAMGISAAVGAYQAHKQAQTSKDIAKIQVDSGKQAMDFQRQLFAQQQQNLAPYQQAGAQGLGNLSALLGPGGRLSTPYGRQFNPNLPGGGSLGPPPNQGPPNELGLGYGGPMGPPQAPQGGWGGPMPFPPPDQGGPMRPPPMRMMPPRQGFA